jgi:drug/metabolite transporter (DMT)-like permease
LNTPSQNPAAPLLAATFVTALWGLSFVSTKTLLGHIAPIQVAFLRHLLATCSIWLAVAFARPPLRVHESDLPRMVAASLIGIPVYFYFENTALLYIPAALASIVTASSPAMTAVIESRVKKRGLSPAGWAGILLSAAGVAFVVTGDATQALQNANYFRGISMVLISSLAWAVYTVLNGPLVRKYGALATNAHQISLATAVLAIMAIPGGMPGVSVIARPQVAFNLAYLGIACSFLAYVLYLFALRRLGPTLVSVFINLVPVFGVAGSAVILGERLTGAQLLGGAGVVVGIFVVERSQRKAGPRCTS